MTASRFFRIVLFAIAGYVAFVYFTLPGAGIIALRDRDPEMSALMRQRWEEAGGTLEIKNTFVPLEKIAPSFVRAVLAVEDGGFYRHSGIDWRALENAMKRNERSGRIRFGGSTITMQLAKNLFLSNDRSYLRKVKEAILTFRLEKHLPKKRILEIYLNIIELGPGIFGAEAAARHYYHKSAASMSREESIRLAAIISSPLKHTPFENGRFINRRKGTIYRKIGG
ncbi:MAG: monofunctional biosynthetic peptidoglycan transglycosylase [Ignavibacteriae bacterium]|nr:monofunctional biosynthetic peptidoglycan transglycosylase [Ignavibacteriota bacterium]